MRMTVFLAAVVFATASCKSPAQPAGPEPGSEAAEPTSATPAAAPAEPNAAATSPAPASSEGEAVLHIDGMVCEGCANAAKSCLEGIDGVAQVEVSFQEGTARVRFDGARTSAQALATAIEAVDRGAAPAFHVTSVEGSP